MIWTRKTLTQTSDWFNQKPLAPLDETLRLPLALGELLRLLKEEYGIVLGKEPLIVNKGYFYFRFYRDYFFQIILQPRALFSLLVRLFRETDKAKIEWEQNVKRFLKEVSQLKHQDLTTLTKEKLWGYTKEMITWDAYWIFKLGFELPIFYHYLSESLLKFLYCLLVKDKYSQNYGELLVGYPGKLKEADEFFWKVVRGEATLDVYLKEYGFRATDVSLAIPTIGEDREQLKQRIDSFKDLTLPNLDNQHERIVARREFREKYVAENFRGWVPFSRWLFNKILALARKYIPIRETRRFYYTMGSFHIRRGLLILADKLDFLENSGDIFFLTKNELEKAVFKPEVLEKRKIQGEIGQRKNQWERWSKWIPPERSEL